MAPHGRDAALAADILGKAGVPSRICANLDDLTGAITEGAGAALLTEEGLARRDVLPLQRWVAAQPSWSDFPFILLAAPRFGASRGAQGLAWLDGLGNAVLLERPLGAAVLSSAVRAALRARGRQYQARTLLAEYERTAAQIAALNASLEERVAARTAELRAEARERERAEAMLIQAQKMEVLGQLAGGVAHDVNNVLQAVLGGARMIVRRPDDPAAVTRLAGMVVDAALRGAGVARRLLALARRGKLQVEPVDAHHMFAGLQEVLAHTLGGAVTVHVEAGSDLPPVLADRGQLETVLVNLAVNARDAIAPQAGAVTFSAVAEEVASGEPHPSGLAPGSYLRLAVADDGPGMDAGTLARATEPFFTTKPRGKGTGLGLSMARGFAEQSGGAMHIDSALERGTIVTLWLPQAGKAVEPPTAPPAASVVAAPGRTQRRCVLLVDDEPQVRTVLAAGIAERGHVVIQAVDAAAALARLDAGEPVDLLITDLAMPGQDGLTLIRAARTRHPGLAALLITGHVGDATSMLLDQAASDGPFGLVHKPVMPDELADRADAMMSAA
ncbi:response regulator [Belnapia sp. T18]|uniref:histidine kinase n=1 Tax=Belnapia arida TaxID=2804533 RepID=A0ABS1UB33_9PROT|nr:response regulator [Belnapia arida]